MQIVRNVPLLRRMARAGAITLHADTGKRVRNALGIEVTSHYVKGGESRFTFGKSAKLYALRYFDGCFYPFVCEL